MCKSLVAACAISLLTVIAGCASEGVRVDPSIEVVTTEEFNLKDLQTICQKSVSKMLALESLARVLPESAENPFVYVASIRNRTDEHIDPEMIREYLSVEILNTGRVRLTEVKKGFDEAVDALEFQQGQYVDPTTTSKVGKMTGAKYFLQGELSSMNVGAGWKKAQAYLFTLTLVNIETLESVKSLVEIQKISKRGFLGW